MNTFKTLKGTLKERTMNFSLQRFHNAEKTGVGGFGWWGSVCLFLSHGFSFAKQKSELGLLNNF